MRNHHQLCRISRRSIISASNCNKNFFFRWLSYSVLRHASRTSRSLRMTPPQWFCPSEGSIEGSPEVSAPCRDDERPVEHWGIPDLSVRRFRRSCDSVVCPSLRRNSPPAPDAPVCHGTPEGAC